MSDRQLPPRVRVTSPRTRAGRGRALPVTQEIDQQTSVGEVYVRSLVRAQLRLAGLVCGALAVLLGGLPLLFASWPQLSRVSTFGVPLPWLILGVLVYPVLTGLAWFYVRHAERNERDFADLVDRS